MKDKTEFFLNASNVAVLRTDRLGDFILTLNMFKAVRAVNPRAKLTAIINKYAEPLTYNQTCIDEVISISNFGELKDVFARKSFEVCFFPRPRLQECWLAFSYRIPLRIGTGYRYYSFLFNYRIYEHRKDGLRHESDYNVRMVNSIAKKEFHFGYPQIFCNSEWDIALEHKLQSLHVNIPERFFICHPGSGGSARELEAEKFALLNKYLSQRFYAQCVITGVENEAEKCGRVQKLSGNAINLCGKLSLTEMIALINRSAFFVSNSTGVLHIASALGKYAICFYPNSSNISAKRWGPNPERSIIITPPVDIPQKMDDMSLIAFEEILEKIENSSFESWVG